MYGIALYVYSHSLSRDGNGAGASYGMIAVFM